MKCTVCGSKQGVLGVLTMDLAAIDYVCDACQRQIAQKESERQRHLRELAAQIVVTSTHSIDGYAIRKYLGIESVECVIGTGMFSEITTNVRDFFGLRSTAFEKKLQHAKKAAFDALKMLAAEKGANAVVGVDLDYTEFSGNRIGLIINGTMVQIVPIQ